jgi:O-antigen ligase
VDAPDWNITLLVLAVLTVALATRSTAPPLPGLIAWPLAAVTLWPLVQIVPLPFAIVRMVSPMRAELAAHLGNSAWVPISAFPAVTLGGWMRISGCLLAFLVIRELAWRFAGERSPWILVWPLVAVAALEAALPLMQFYAAPGDSAHGTFRNRDHFAFFMEIALPFPVMYAWSVWRRQRSHLASSFKPALLACAALGAAGLLLGAVLTSLSRMGLIASLFGLAVLGAGFMLRRRWILMVPVAAVVAMLVLAPRALILRFADLSTADRVASQDRIKVWRETLPMISRYWITGSGLDTFEFVFPRYKRHAATTVDNATHNDYLQYISELGIIGSTAVLFLLVGVLVSVKAALHHADAQGRALAIASLGSVAALLLHSTVDFNTYVPVNAFACAWICAVAVSSVFSVRPVAASSGVVEMIPDSIGRCRPPISRAISR